MANSIYPSSTISVASDADITLQINDVDADGGAGPATVQTLRTVSATDSPDVTSLSLIDDTIFTDDAVFTPATSKVQGVGFIVDDTATDSVDEGDIGAPRMSVDRIIYIQGALAHDAVDAGNPIKIGGKAVDPASMPADVSANDRVNQAYDLKGRPIVYLGTALDSTNDSVSILHSTHSNINTSAAAASLVIKASAGRLIEIRGYNSKASAQFIQVHDASSLPADTAVPEETFTVPASSNFYIEFLAHKSFTTGIVVCNSSTMATKTIGSADCWFSADYR